MPAELTRGFLDQVVRGSGWSLAEVESLSLEGEGISSLRGSFDCVGRLVYLNLARNNLSSLLGIESLASLATLDLRENCVEGMDEVGRLAGLSNLRDLDLRFNPIVEEKFQPTFAIDGSSGSGVDNTGSGRRSSNLRAEVLWVLPQLTSLNGRKVADIERQPRQLQHQQQRERVSQRQHHRRLKNSQRMHHQYDQEPVQENSTATSVPPFANDAPTVDENKVGLDTRDTGFGTSSSRRHFGKSVEFLPAEAVVTVEKPTGVVAPGQSHHREKLPQRAPKYRSQKNEKAGEGEFNSFFPVATTIAAAKTDDIITIRGDHRVVTAVGQSPSSHSQLSSYSVSSRRQDYDREGLRRFGDDGGGAATPEDDGRTGDRNLSRWIPYALHAEAAASAPPRQPQPQPQPQPLPSRSDMRYPIERPSVDVVAGRKTNNIRPSADIVRSTSPALDIGALPPDDVRYRYHRGGVRGGSDRASVAKKCPDRAAPAAPAKLRCEAAPSTVVQRRTTAGHASSGRRDRRTTTTMHSDMLDSCHSGEDDGDGDDDLARLWLELGTDESLMSQETLTSSPAVSSRTSGTTTTATVSAAARAVEAFRRISQKLGLPLSSATARVDEKGGDRPYYCSSVADHNRVDEDRDGSPRTDDAATEASASRTSSIEADGWHCGGTTDCRHEDRHSFGGGGGGVRAGLRPPASVCPTGGNGPSGKAVHGGSPVEKRNAQRAPYIHEHKIKQQTGPPTPPPRLVSSPATAIPPCTMAEDSFAKAAVASSVASSDAGSDSFMTTRTKAVTPSTTAAGASSKLALGIPLADGTARCAATGSGVLGASPNMSATVGGEVVPLSPQDARLMDELWLAREREFTARWEARERELDARWAAREREFEQRLCDESKHFAAHLRSMLLGAHETLTSYNAWLAGRLNTVEAPAAAASAAEMEGLCPERSPFSTGSSSASSGHDLKQSASGAAGAGAGVGAGAGAAVAGTCVVGRDRSLPATATASHCERSVPPGARRANSGAGGLTAGTLPVEVLAGDSGILLAQGGSREGNRTGRAAHREEALREVAHRGVGAKTVVSVTEPVPRVGDRLGSQEDREYDTSTSTRRLGVAPALVCAGGDSREGCVHTSSEGAVAQVTPPSCPQEEGNDRKSVGISLDGCMAPTSRVDVAGGNGGVGDPVNDAREGGVSGHNPEVTVSAAQSH